mmetsp:Transcript_10442/g.33154  ORF Transcript_10442/g.33154 Transcript_10442/m.33154 type:complete len:264 (+) Transcript_10442:1612-2403(+)
MPLVTPRRGRSRALRRSLSTSRGRSTMTEPGAGAALPAPPSSGFANPAGSGTAGSILPTLVKSSSSSFRKPSNGSRRLLPFLVLSTGSIPAMAWKTRLKSACVGSLNDFSTFTSVAYSVLGAEKGSATGTDTNWRISGGGGGRSPFKYAAKYSVREGGSRRVVTGTGGISGRLPPATSRSRMVEIHMSRALVPKYFVSACTAAQSKRYRPTGSPNARAGSASRIFFMCSWYNAKPTSDSRTTFSISRSRTLRRTQQAQMNSVA